MINNEARRPGGLQGTEEEEAAAAAAAAERYAASMRQQQAAQAVGDVERGKALTKSFKEGDTATRAAMTAQFQLTPGQIAALSAPPALMKRPVFWISAAAAGGLILFFILRKGAPRRSK